MLDLITQHPILSLSTTLIASLLTYVLLPKRSQSDIARLPGPSSDSLLVGNIDAIGNPWSISPPWHTTYSRTFAVHGFFNKKRLYTTDPRAIGYILNKSSEFGKPWQTRLGIQTITGPGLLVAEGAVHKRQVRF